MPVRRHPCGLVRLGRTRDQATFQGSWPGYAVGARELYGVRGESRDPVTESGPQVRPVSRGDLAALHLPGHCVQVAGRELLPVDIKPAYDGHRDLLKLQRG